MLVTSGKLAFEIIDPEDGMFPVGISEIVVTKRRFITLFIEVLTNPKAGTLAMQDSHNLMPILDACLEEILHNVSGVSINATFGDLAATGWAEILHNLWMER